MAYATRSDIEDVFGEDNVLKWADLDNDQVTSKIAARIATALADVDAYVNDFLRAGPYTVPLTATYRTVTRAAATLAGVWLYEARGVQDVNDVTGAPLHKLAWHKRSAEDILRRIVSGGIRLDDENAATMIPQVVLDEDEDDDDDS
jgi:phage gp36-like protein